MVDRERASLPTRKIMKPSRSQANGGRGDANGKYDCISCGEEYQLPQAVIQWVAN